MICLHSATYQAVAAAVEEVGSVYLKPIFERLGGTVDYGQIRIVIAHLRLEEHGSSMFLHVLTLLFPFPACSFILLN